VIETARYGRVLALEQPEPGATRSYLLHCLDKIIRYTASTSRALSHAIKELETIEAARKAREDWASSTDAEAAAPSRQANPEIAKRTRVSAFESGPCPKTARYPSRTEVDEPPSVRRQDRSTVLTVENVGRFFPTGIDRIEEVFANGAPRAVAAPGAQTQNRIVVVERIIRDGAARCLEGRRLLKFFTHSTEKGRPVSRRVDSSSQLTAIRLKRL